MAISITNNGVPIMTIDKEGLRRLIRFRMRVRRGGKAPAHAEGDVPLDLDIAESYTFTDRIASRKRARGVRSGQHFPLVLSNREEDAATVRSFRGALSEELGSGVLAELEDLFNRIVRVAPGDRVAEIAVSRKVDLFEDATKQSLQLGVFRQLEGDFFEGIFRFRP